MSYDSFTEALRPLASRMPQIVREREILRVAAILDRNGPGTAETARREVLKWVKNQAGGWLPKEALDHQSFDHLAGGRNCSGIRMVDDSTDIWAIRSDRPDRHVAQRVWTTESTIGHLQSEAPRIGVRSLVSSPEDKLAIAPAVPGFLRQIAAICPLRSGPLDLSDAPWVVGSEEDAERLIEILVDPQRELPVFALTVPDDPRNESPLLDPVSLAQTTLGIASVVVIPAQFTWALTERFGKRLSVFGGAVRVYLPGFSEDANPYGGHELILREEISTATDAEKAGNWMRRLAASESITRVRLGRGVLSFTAVRQQSLDLSRSRLEYEGASDTDQLVAAQKQINLLKGDLRQALDAQQWFSDEHKVAEDRAKTAEAQLTAAEFRIRQLTDQLKARGEAPDTNIPLPSCWDAFADWCEQHLVGRLLLSPRARREVKSPLFQEVSVAARCLLWLANDYRERRLGGGDGGLRFPFESGIRNDRCGADGFLFDWQGKRYNVEWHVKNGGNTRAPALCLRIYYFWDDASQQVIIASMPAHRPTGAT